MTPHPTFDPKTWLILFVVALYLVTMILKIRDAEPDDKWMD